MKFLAFFADPFISFFAPSESLTFRSHKKTLSVFRDPLNLITIINEIIIGLVGTKARLARSWKEENKTKINNWY